MESEGREALRSHLQDSREMLGRQLPSLKESSRPVAPDNALGRLTRMEAIQSKEINQNAYRGAQAQLAAMDRALSHIDDTDFGLCSECESPIPLGRLKALPGSTRCVRCA